MGILNTANEWQKSQERLNILKVNIFHLIPISSCTLITEESEVYFRIYSSIKSSLPMFYFVQQWKVLSGNHTASPSHSITSETAQCVQRYIYHQIVSKSKLMLISVYLCITITNQNSIRRKIKKLTRSFQTVSVKNWTKWFNVIESLLLHVAKTLSAKSWKSSANMKTRK